MKRILFLLIAFAAFKVQAQDTVKVYTGSSTPMSTRMYQYKSLKIDSSLWVKGNARFDDSVSFGKVVFLPVVADGDSSSRAATTAWVKRNVTGGGGGTGSVDSVTYSNDSLYYWAGGISTLVGVLTGGSTTPDTIITKYPLYTITGGPHDSVAIAYGDSILVHVKDSSGFRVYTQMNGDRIVLAAGGSGTDTSYRATEQLSDTSYKQTKSNSSETIFIYEGLAPANYYTGWADYNDSAFTVSSPLNITSGNKVTLPNNASYTNESQQPVDIAHMFNVSDTTITGRNGDGLNVTIEFSVKPTTASVTRITVTLDIGGSVGEIYPRDFILTKGNGVEHFYLSSFDAYTLGTWESNGAKVKVVSDAAASIYNIRYILTRTHKAR